MKRILVLVVVLLLPSFAFAAAPRTFSDLADLIVSLFDAGVGLLITAALVIYLFGISRSIFKAGEEGKEALRTYVLWGILTIFLMVSIWGILQLLQNTLFGGTTYAPGQSSGSQTYFQ
ncbi:MAG: protein of unknown function with transrane region [Candidatus Kaiserbacteria bacterium]|nr:protein of unknown function with transrane region [Candidatus Kaiserbacteria bacterium]